MSRSIFVSQGDQLLLECLGRIRPFLDRGHSEDNDCPTFSVEPVHTQVTDPELEDPLVGHGLVASLRPDPASGSFDLKDHRVQKREHVVSSPLKLALETAKQFLDLTHAILVRNRKETPMTRLPLIDVSVSEGELSEEHDINFKVMRVP